MIPIPVFSGGYRSRDGCPTIGGSYRSIQVPHPTGNQAAAHVGIGGNGSFYVIREVYRVGMGGRILCAVVIRIEVIVPFNAKDGWKAIL